MPARVLIVDDTETNIKFLKARLEADYFDVLTAATGEAGLERAISEQPDIVLLDVMMPGIDGYETCRRLKQSPQTRHIPVIILTALDGREDRLSGLEAGADDFLTKPFDEALLIARVKALVRLKVLNDDLRAREQTSAQIGLMAENALTQTLSATGNVLVLDDNELSAARLIAHIGTRYRAAFETDPDRALKIAAGRVDLIVLNMQATSFDPLRWASRLRSSEATRARPILGIVAPENRDALLRGLDLGIDDFLIRPLDSIELLARARTAIRRKRYADFLRRSLDASIEMAWIDPLTGLNNRRFLDARMAALMGTGNTSLSVLIVDIDHFKRINDTFGHDGGDTVLREFARRLATHVRAQDIACRFGGEEFVVLMPGADDTDALSIAERVRARIEASPFDIGSGGSHRVTVSVGVATARPDDTPESLFKRADDGVYEAKETGRNRVVVRPAA